MTVALNKQAFEIRLARCLELAKQFPTGQTAEMLIDLEAELRDQLRTLEAKPAS